MCLSGIRYKIQATLYTFSLQNRILCCFVCLGGHTWRDSVLSLHSESTSDRFKGPYRIQGSKPRLAVYKTLPAVISIQLLECFVF